MRRRSPPARASANRPLSCSPSSNKKTPQAAPKKSSGGGGTAFYGPNRGLVFGPGTQPPSYLAGEVRFCLFVVPSFVGRPPPPPPLERRRRRRRQRQSRSIRPLSVKESAVVVAAVEAP